MTRKSHSSAHVSEPGEALCCPPDEQTSELLAAPVDGAAADDELAAFARALAHPTRVRILRMLAKKEARMCNHVVDELPLAQSTVSEHLRILRSAGLIQANENGPRQLLHRPVGVEAAQSFTQRRAGRLIINREVEIEAP